jgi:YVTN family beta-propeller protein
VIRILLFLLWSSVIFAQDRLYVVQTNDESLGQINLANGQVTSHVLDLGVWGNDVVLHGTHLFVANSGDNTIQEIDATTNTTLRAIPLAGGISPWSLAFLNDDTIAVTCWQSRNVLLLRYSDGATIDTLALPSGPEGLMVQGERLLVCETGVDFPNYLPGYLRVYDRHSLVPLDSIEVGVNAQYVSADDLGRLHVICTGDYGSVAGTIYVLDGTTLSLDTVLAIGGTPNTVSFGGGFAYVAAGGFGDAGYVYRYELSSLTMLNGSSNPITTAPGATDIEATSDGTFFVSCLQTDEVRRHSATGAWLETYPMADGPSYMVLYPAPSSADGRGSRVPRAIQLVYAYPNPFNGTVTFGLAAPARQSGELRIVNELGQDVTRLPVRAGDSEVPWYGGENASGSYFAVIGGSSVRVSHLR